MRQRDATMNLNTKCQCANEISSANKLLYHISGRTFEDMPWIMILGGELKLSVTQMLSSFSGCHCLCHQRRVIVHWMYIVSHRRQKGLHAARAYIESILLLLISPNFFCSPINEFQIPFELSPIHGRTVNGFDVSECKNQSYEIACGEFLRRFAISSHRKNISAFQFRYRTKTNVGNCYKSSWYRIDIT